MRGVFGDDRDDHPNEVKLGMVVIVVVFTLFTVAWIAWGCGG